MNEPRAGRNLCHGSDGGGGGGGGNLPQQL